MSIKPDYSWPTVEDYEKCAGLPVNDAFRVGWNMARTTDTMLGIKSDTPTSQPAVPQDMRMVPASLLEELESSLYEFGQGRCFTSIDLDRYKRLGEVLAATPAAPSQPAMQGEPVAQVSDLFPSIRTKLCEMGFEPESPLYTAPAEVTATATVESSAFHCVTICLSCARETVQKLEAAK